MWTRCGLPWLVLVSPCMPVYSSAGQVTVGRNCVHGSTTWSSSEQTLHLISAGVLLITTLGVTPAGVSLVPARLPSFPFCPGGGSSCCATPKHNGVGSGETRRSRLIARGECGRRLNSQVTFPLGQEMLKGLDQLTSP